MPYKDETATKTATGKVATRMKPDKPEQFSIRLSPKLKLGLEMLAKLQGRSLSQAAEWSIKVGLNAQRLPTNEKYFNVAELLEDVAPLSEFDRVVRFWKYAQSLLTFEEASAAELLFESQEWLKACAAEDEIERNALKQIYLEQMKDHWPAIKAEGARRAEAGESLERASMKHVTKIKF